MKTQTGQSTFPDIFMEAKIYIAGEVMSLNRKVTPNIVFRRGNYLLQSDPEMKRHFKKAPGNLILLSTFLTLITLLFTACNNNPSLFNKIPSSKSGINFNNQVTENDSINPIDLEFIYNGGGIAVGDFNNDGLADLYFTASTGSNKLYQNKGMFAFKDITGIAGVTGEGRWSNAASVVDINNDGLADIYVCATIRKNPEQRRNLFYINQGINKEGIPTFKEMAREYNLADTSLSVHAAFFDYDNDGDLDMYLVTTKLAQRDATQFMNNNTGDTSKNDFDKLFRNDWNDSLKHPVFTDVSAQAGIAHHGYGLGVAIADINKDGWKDIYVTNDFYGSDLLYMNNHHGGFTEKLKSIFKHTSQNAMGNDIADINNDGLADVIAVDMNPEDNYRKKKNMNGNNYFIYQNMMNGRYMLQYVRNTLQLNQGPVLNAGDSIGEPVFSDISFLSGVAETDWSWNPSIADFDNDGNRDIIITNGYPRDVTDHDFAAFRQRSGNIASKEYLIGQMPQIKVANYAFKNSGDLKFTKVTAEWGMETASFSNGAVYADLDNDGDLDYVINNINDEAFVYENTTNSKEEIAKNYLSIQFNGGAGNINGIGAIATIFYAGNKLQVYENSPYRGYLSTVDCKAFFGLDNIKTVDSVTIQWNNGKKQAIPNVATNQLLKVDIANAGLLTSTVNEVVASTNLFTDVTTSLGISYRNFDPDFIDFNEQRLLPHKLSEYGPALATGDVDSNGLDDIIISGTGDYPANILLQQSNGKFISKLLPVIIGHDVRRPESLGTILFDADNDGDLDLYLASGSNQFAPGTKNYQDWFYTNDGKGNFSFNETAFPKNYTSKSCAKAVDFDNDGDLDLFIGGRVLPGKYPLPVSSFIYRNDSKNGEVKFTDVTNEVAPGLQNIGLTCDGLWTDFDNDGWTDLVIAGEWMPIQFFKNNKGRLENISAGSGINYATGWWNSITAGDFDNDGDIDYIAGNLGKNSFYRASHDFPVNMYAKDFDKNQALDIITTLYLPDENGKLKEFPAQTRDDQVEQVPALKRKFLTYKEFGKATIDDIFSRDDMKDALKLQANYFESSYIENTGQGKFKLHALPVLAQVAPLYAMVVDDFNHDGNLDVAMNGNDFGTEVGNGRYDALNGLVLLGDGKGNFSPLSILQSGLYIPGNGKALIKCRGSDNNYLLAASQNNGPLKIFSSKTKQKIIAILPNDKYWIYTLKNGKKRKEESYIGNSYLSQSAPFITTDETVGNVEITNNKGEKRNLH
ncbi:MAG: VCBS repeat-containing protein [Ferruginibacter sp.]